MYQGNKVTQYKLLTGAIIILISVQKIILKRSNNENNMKRLTYFGPVFDVRFAIKEKTDYFVASLETSER